MLSKTTDSNNSLWLAIQYSLSLILSLISLKLNLLSFGNTFFSIWLLLTSVWSIGAALDLGFGISVVRFIAKSKENYSKLREITSTCLLLFQILGILIFGICYLIADYIYFPNRKIFPAETISDLRVVFLILGINFYIQYITIVFRSVFEGFNQYVIISKIAIWYNITNFLFTAAVLIFSLHLYHLAIFNLVTSTFQFGVYIFFINKYFPYLKIKLLHFNKSLFKEIFTFSFAIQSTYLLGALIDPAIKFIIGNYSDKRHIPSYEIARKFSWAVSGLFSFTFKNTLPKTSILSKVEEYRFFLLNEAAGLSRFSIVFSSIFFGIFSFVFAILFHFFYKNDDCLLIFYIFALSESVNNVGYVLYVFIMGIGKAAFLTIVQASNVIITSVFLILGLLLFHGNIGLIGYFISVFISNCAMLVLIRKYTGIDLKELLNKMNIKNLFVLLAFNTCHLVFIIIKPQYWLISQSLLLVLNVVYFREDLISVIRQVNIYVKSKFLSKDLLKAEL